VYTEAMLPFMFKLIQLPGVSLRGDEYKLLLQPIDCNKGADLFKRILST